MEAARGLVSAGASRIGLWRRDKQIKLTARIRRSDVSKHEAGITGEWKPVVH
jgi:hypothetical protein